MIADLLKKLLIDLHSFSAFIPYISILENEQLNEGSE